MLCVLPAGMGCYAGGRNINRSAQGRKGENYGLVRCERVYARARIQTMLTRDAKLNER